jgi:signal transduction histidine kinase
MDNLAAKTTSSFTSFFKTLSKLMAVLVLAGSFLVLIGWHFNITLFKSIRPNLPLIAPNSGVCLFFSSAALLLLNSGKKKIYPLAYFLASLVCLAGIITLMEYALKIDFGFSQIIFRNAVGTNGLPVRMSPQSAVNFLVIGLALLLMEKQTKTGRKPSQYLILIVGAISLVSFFGFVNDLPKFYTISPYKGMAAHTAVFFILLFAAIFISRPETGLMKNFSSEGISGFVARRLFATLFAVVVADIVAMAGHTNGFYSHETEAILHVILITIAFVYLMFIGFGSLGKIQSLEEIDRAKSEFVSFVSHQLRTPLTAIKWGIEALLKTPDNLNKGQKESLEEIAQSSERMINLTNAFLDISKIEMGGFLLEARKTNIVEIAQGLIKELSPQIKEKSINVIKKYGEGLEEINVDSKLVQIVLQNLLTNAVKYTSAGGKIELSIERGYHELKIKISDSGAGIPEEQKKFVFAKLFRGANVKEKTEGSGVGLYMVKNLLNRTNGKIWFESKEGQGTTFYVVIPA